jgi:hypothetical protein
MNRSEDKEKKEDMVAPSAQGSLVGFANAASATRVAKALALAGGQGTGSTARLTKLIGSDKQRHNIARS